MALLRGDVERGKRIPLLALGVDVSTELLDEAHNNFTVPLCARGEKSLVSGIAVLLNQLPSALHAGNCCQATYGRLNLSSEHNGRVYGYSVGARCLLCWGVIDRLIGCQKGLCLVLRFHTCYPNPNVKVYDGEA